MFIKHTQYRSAARLPMSIKLKMQFVLFFLLAVLCIALVVISIVSTMIQLGVAR